MEKEMSMKPHSPENKPTMTVFAGTNGAGKSELTNILKHQSPETEIIDADAIARQLNPKDPAKANIEAGRETLRRVNFCIEQGKDFSIETTLGGGNALRQMVKAKQAGFHVNLYYVGLENPELHIDRVAQRVSKGGHHIPEADIRRRYHTSLKNLPKAMRLADHSFVFDNTEVYKIKLETEHGLIRFQDPELPRWVKEAIKDWKAEQTQILKDFDQERDRLSKQIQEVRQELTEARESLQPVHEKESLLRQYAAHAARYDELRPKNILDKVLQPNRDELKQIEETLSSIEKKIEQIDRQLPENIPAIQNRVTSLGNTLDSLVKAHDRVVNKSLAVQNQMMASKMQRTYSQVQHIIQDISPTLGR